MKIKLTRQIDSDYRQKQEMFVGEEKVWGASDLAQDCPEDATLDRDMTNGLEIIDLMRLSFEAGKNGEDFIFEIEPIKNV